MNDSYTIIYWECEYTRNNRLYSRWH